MSNNKQSSLDKEFVPYIEALALKELGFDEFCFGYWGLDEYSNVILETRSVSQNGDLAKNSCNAPTFSQAFRWFREKHGLDNAILKDRFVIETEEDLPNWYYGFKTYEEAELACLNKLIEIVKNK